MGEVFGRSWRLTKLSFSIVLQDKEMLLFPLLGGLASLLFSLVLLFPTILVSWGDGAGFGALEYLLLFITYFGLSFIATFFNVCVVFTTRTRFEGGDATFKDSLNFASTRLPQIVQWALVSASVGMLLRLLDVFAEKLGEVGQMVMGFIINLIGMAWTIVTIFVVPVMVYEGVGPKDAIKRSAETLKSTWGESLIRHYGLGLMQFLAFIAAAGIGWLLFATVGQLGTAGVVISAIVTLILILGVVMTFNVASTVFNTALFAYAQGNTLPGTFDEDTLSHAFKVRGTKR
ncbi:MAG: hypothetical protein ACI9WU_004876 [Myxococcota bacterium]|jgi:hypothetical protein